MISKCQVSSVELGAEITKNVDRWNIDDKTPMDTFVFFPALWNIIPGAKMLIIVYPSKYWHGKISGMFWWTGLTFNSRLWTPPGLRHRRSKHFTQIAFQWSGLFQWQWVAEGTLVDGTMVPALQMSSEGGRLMESTLGVRRRWWDATSWAKNKRTVIGGERGAEECNYSWSLRARCQAPIIIHLIPHRAAIAGLRVTLWPKGAPGKWTKSSMHSAAATSPLPMRSPDCLLAWQETKGWQGTHRG